MTRVGILEEVPLGKLQRCLTVSTTTCRPSPGGNSGFAHLQLRFILVRKSSPHHHLTEMVEEFDLRARTRGQPPAFGSKPEEHVQARCDHTHIILSLPPSNMPFTPLTTNGRILQRCHSTSPGQASTYKTLMQSCIYTSQHHLQAHLPVWDSMFRHRHSFKRCWSYQSCIWHRVNLEATKYPTTQNNIHCMIPFI